MPSTNNAINLITAGIVGYNGAGVFTATPVTTANVLVAGGANDTIINVPPSGNIGVPLVSNGASSTPSFSTCNVVGGGTGVTTLTAFELLAAGTSSTSPVQQIGIGSSAQVLVSNGAGVLPSFQNAGVTVWSDQASSFFTTAGNGYFCTGAGTAILNASPSQGDTVSIFADTGSSVVIQAAAGQTIRIGTGTSSIAGTATSATQGNSITLVYRAASTTWDCIYQIGTWVLA